MSTLTPTGKTTIYSYYTRNICGTFFRTGGGKVNKIKINLDVQLLKEQNVSVSQSFSFPETHHMTTIMIITVF